MFKKNAVRTKYRPEYPANFNFDFKDPVTLSRFVSEGGKIVPSRISKLSARQQRALNQAVKRARQMALLPQGSDAYDSAERAEPVSPQPFEY